MQRHALVNYRLQDGQFARDCDGRRPCRSSFASPPRFCFASRLPSLACDCDIAVNAVKSPAFAVHVQANVPSACPQFGCRGMFGRRDRAPSATRLFRPMTRLLIVVPSLASSRPTRNMNRLAPPPSPNQRANIRTEPRGSSTGRRARLPSSSSARCAASGVGFSAESRRANCSENMKR